MGLKAGDVVVLKSGGQALTVSEVTDEMIECVWIGEEGDLFREKLPASVLELAHIDMSDDEDEEEDEDGEENEDEGDDHHAKKTAEVA
ncbi:YodC family protein [Afipia sp. DC4300-2b1]|uniref:YodC family protein n=1 Tax=Afipia sp. DC4300-2b1 TaxID=2804672 RepID=UPI003CF25CD1